MNAPSPAATTPAERTPAALGREAPDHCRHAPEELLRRGDLQPPREADLRRRPGGERGGHPGLRTRPATRSPSTTSTRSSRTGRKSQRLAAIQSLAAIRAPSSVGMLIKYFNHFSGEDDVRTAILGALNAIAPSSPQVQELDQAVLVDPRQGEEARRIAVEALVDASRTRASSRSAEADRQARAAAQAGVPAGGSSTAACCSSGVQEVPDFTARASGSRPARRLPVPLHAEGGQQGADAEAGPRQVQRPLPRLTLPAELGARLPQTRASARPCAASCSASRTSRDGCGSPSGCFRLLLVIPRSSTSRPRG